MDDGVKVPVPQWLQDAVKPNLYRADKSAPPPKKPDPVSQEVATAFMAEIVKLCRVHGVWLAHEDAYGGFIVQRENTEAWLMRGFGS
jgi:hypothetical protein